MKRLVTSTFAAIALVAGMHFLPAAGLAQSGSLKAVMNGELRSLDPIWTAAPQTRTHAFMVYDTLFGTDAELQPQPQMVSEWSQSEDRLQWSFTLRDELKFSDGSDVTTADVVASWKRWAEKDPGGQAINRVLKDFEIVDDKTFKVNLSEPFVHMLWNLGKPLAQPLFVMPQEIAALPSSEQITDPTGSGPFMMIKEEWVPGSKVVYAPNPHYLPREEPASGISGGKRVFFERVELVSIPDASTQVSALMQGEIDFVERPSPDLLGVLRQNPDITVEPQWQGNGSLGVMRLNWTNPPFDKPEIRRAIQSAVVQPDIHAAVSLDPTLARVCGAILMCGTADGSEANTDLLLSDDPIEARIERTRALLAEAGYNNEPIVIMDPTDSLIPHSAAIVVADALQRAGANVDLQTMDWSTLIARRSNPGPGPNGWHIFFSTGGQLSTSIMGFSPFASAACEKAMPGWPCDDRLEEIRAAWMQESDPAKRRALGEEFQKRGMDMTLYIPYGEFISPQAWRNDLSDWLSMPELIIYWNVKRAG